MTSTSYELSLPPTDALPYYDDHLDKVGMREKVEREIAREMKNGSVDQIVDDRLPPSMLLFSERSDLLELANGISEGKTTNALDRTRYHLAAPEAGLDASEEEWNRAISNAEIQLQHSETRLTNLELLKKYGANHWRLHNFQQEAFLRHHQQSTTDVRNTTMALNRSRKQRQTEAGIEITRLNKKWAELLNRSLNVEFANMAIMTDIEALEARRDELKKQLETQEAAAAA